MTSLAIIPARGGSKRIPKKNIKPFLGKPIIAYSIEVALKSKLFDEVMVSTDDEEIAKIALEYGAKVPFFRSKKNADDYATTADVIKEVLEYYKKAGKNYDKACCIYPTAPLLTEFHLTEAFKLLNENQFNTVFSILPYGYPVDRSLVLNDSNGLVVMKYPEHLHSRSQDLERRYHDAGQFYWFSIEHFENSNLLFTKNSGALVLSEMEAQDIDNDVDWKLAELKYRINHGI